ncbi:MAG: ABC transporter ATP-binding protein [Planctomycetota bacterium]|jgi:ABC-type lipoprotein export system ATPase subunit
MITVSDLEFRYSRDGFRLRVADLQVARGEKLAVIGPSGSGKTTLLHLLAGIALPQVGGVTVDNAEMTQLPDAARRAFRIRHIGLVFQEFELLEYLRVLDNILLPYRIHPSMQLDEAVRARAAELAEKAGIGDKLYRLSTRLSHGERQRVAVCRSLLPRPAVILADEPTGNLDPVNRQRITDILFDYIEHSGATMLMVTHDHDMLGRFDRVIDMMAFQANSSAGGDGRASS